MMIATTNGLDNARFQNYSPDVNETQTKETDTETETVKNEENEE